MTTPQEPTGIKEVSTLLGRLTFLYEQAVRHHQYLASRLAQAAAAPDGQRSEDECNLLHRIMTRQASAVTEISDQIETVRLILDQTLTL